MPMNKVSLSLVGVKNGVTREDIAPALAKLYTKPESHFDSHCEHLFELNKPFKLLKKVDPEVAEQHQKHLDGIGIRSMVSEVIDSTSLELIPIANETNGTGPCCPSCGQQTSDSVECSACGVMIKKYNEQKAIDEKLKQKLDMANKRQEKAKEVAKQEAALKKEKPPEKKPEVKLTDPKPTQLSEGTITKIEVVEKGGNVGTLTIAAVALIAVVGGIFTTKAVLKKINEKDQYQFATVEETVTDEVAATVTSAKQAELQLAAARPAKEVDLLIETGTFRDWNAQISRIKKITHQLHTLDEATGMASTMDGLVSQEQDPIVRLIADQQLSKIRLKAYTDGTGTIDDETAQKYNDTLQNNEALIEALPNSLDKMYATLNLGSVYEDIGQTESAANAYRRAKQYAIEVKDQQNQVDAVLVEVMAAEHFEARGVSSRSTLHYEAALAASETIDGTTSEARWAMPFIARSQARAGMFADAYETMDAIPNPEIQGLVMRDITRYASDNDMKSFGPDQTEMTATEREIADDPDLKLLYDNHKIMQENARKGAAIFNTFK